MVRLPPPLLVVGTLILFAASLKNQKHKEKRHSYCVTLLYLETAEVPGLADFPGLLHRGRERLHRLCRGIYSQIKFNFTKTVKYLPVIGTSIEGKNE